MIASQLIQLRPTHFLHQHMKNKTPDFSGKTLSVILIGEEVSHIIVNPRFEM